MRASSMEHARSTAQSLICKNPRGHWRIRQAAYQAQDRRDGNRSHVHHTKRTCTHM